MAWRRGHPGGIERDTRRRTLLSAEMEFAECFMRDEVDTVREVERQVQEYHLGWSLAVTADLPHIRLPAMVSGAHEVEPSLADRLSAPPRDHMSWIALRRKCYALCPVVEVPPEPPLRLTRSCGPPAIGDRPLAPAVAALRSSRRSSRPSHRGSPHDRGSASSSSTTSTARTVGDADASRRQLRARPRHPLLGVGRHRPVAVHEGLGAQQAGDHRQGEARGVEVAPAGVDGAVAGRRGRVDGHGRRHVAGRRRCSGRSECALRLPRQEGR
jgi:hypothetical protein